MQSHYADKVMWLLYNVQWPSQRYKDMFWVNLYSKAGMKDKLSQRERSIITGLDYWNWLLDWPFALLSFLNKIQLLSIRNGILLHRLILEQANGKRMMQCYWWSVKRIESPFSKLYASFSVDSRVVGHNSGLVLWIKDHICSDTVCPVAAYMLITQ